MAKQVYSRISLGLIVMLAIGMSGCTTLEVPPSSGTSGSTPSRGVYHKVQKKETLWRIAKTYGVEINEIIRSNNIPTGAVLEENQLLFIPGVDRVRSIDVSGVPSPAVSAPVPSRASPAMTTAVKDDFGWPVNGRILRHFNTGGSYLNRGISIEAREEQPVLASRQGRVVFADYLAGYSFTVILDHLDGYFTVYAMNSRLAVNLGDSIAKGEKLAYAGRKGATPLVYFEIRRNARAENPMYFLPKS